MHTGRNNHALRYLYGVSPLKNAQGETDFGPLTLDAGSPNAAAMPFYDPLTDGQDHTRSVCMFGMQTLENSE